MTLPELISLCLSEWASKPWARNDEFLLHYDAEDTWTAEIENRLTLVRLGETYGEVAAHGSTPEQAVANLLAAIRAYVPPAPRPTPPGAKTISTEEIVRAAITAPKLSLNKEDPPT